MKICIAQLYRRGSWLRGFEHLMSAKQPLICFIGTIITSFPRRWSKIKPDPSDVHKSLRRRLMAARKDEIRSAYDLALIIIDECSRVFFNRTKSSDKRPNLVDMFAQAISEIVCFCHLVFNFERL